MITRSFASLCIYTIVLVTAIAAAQGGSGLTWGQSCNPSASSLDDPSTRCDTSKRLSCDMRTRACKCHHEERDFYNGGEDRCETKVGKFCSGSEIFPAICVKNAVCDTGTNFCVCEKSAEPNEDGTECLKEEGDDGENFATSVKPSSVHFAIALMLVGGLWL